MGLIPFGGVLEVWPWALVLNSLVVNKSAGQPQVLGDFQLVYATARVDFLSLHPEFFQIPASAIWFILKIFLNCSGSVALVEAGSSVTAMFLDLLNTIWTLFSANLLTFVVAPPHEVVGPCVSGLCL